MTEVLEEQTEFTFAELSQRAKDHAVSTHGQPEYIWWEGTYEFFMDPESDERKQGFNIEKINFSGFSSQGDGACWQGKVRLPEFIKHFYVEPEQQGIREAMLALIFNGDMEPTVRIGSNGNHYCHSYTMTLHDDPVLYNSMGDDEYISKYDGVFNGAHVPQLMVLVEPEIGALGETVLTEARAIADKIYKALEEEYDYLSSEEAFAKTADANDWKFDEAGNLL